MNRGTLRSVGIFIVVALVLLLLTLGGVQFAKNRNTQFASRGAAQPTSNNQNQSPTEAAKPPAASEPAPTQAPATQQTQTPTPQQQTAPQQASSEATSSAPSQVPATGPTEDVIFTVALMMLAAYLGLMLRKAKLAYRRSLS